MVKIELGKKDLIWVGLIVIVIGISIVVAYNPTGAANPAVMGHSANEVEGVQKLINANCTTGQYMYGVSSGGSPLCRADVNTSGSGIKCITPVKSVVSTTGNYNVPMFDPVSNFHLCTQSGCMIYLYTEDSTSAPQDVATPGYYFQGPLGDYSEQVGDGGKGTNGDASSSTIVNWNDCMLVDDYTGVENSFLRMTLRDTNNNANRCVVTVCSVAPISA